MQLFKVYLLPTFVIQIGLSRNVLRFIIFQNAKLIFYVN